MTGWSLDGFCVQPCPECRAPGDTPCKQGCVNQDFRDAEFADVDGQWPTEDERYR